jgi:adenylate cyclase class IV
MQNYEFKAELRDPSLARAICKKINAPLSVRLRQTDTYYNISRGRLKKRESIALDRAVGSPEPVEYIFYERPTRVAPKVSEFQLYSQAELMERYGQSPLPIWLVVEKTRELYMWNGVRLHIDEVIGLGWYFEFEILVSGDEAEGLVEKQAEQLRATFAPVLGEPIAGSYSDLLAQVMQIADHRRSIEHHDENERS